MTTAERSRVMRAVKGRDTAPERMVRSLLHRQGFRFRLHRNDLPGTPDIVFPGRKCVVFVHGCFWHGHNCKRGARAPRSNADYWRAKIARNIERNRSQLDELARSGWRVCVVWECETRDTEALARRLSRFLRQGQAPDENAA